jgi:hypothetical protein
MKTRTRAIRLIAALWFAGCSQREPAFDELASGPPVSLASLATAPWTPLGPPEVYGRKDLDLAIGKSAEHCLPYRFEEAQVSTMKWEEATAEVMLCRCRSTEQAFGLFTARRAEARVGRALDDVGALASSDGETVRAWKGRYDLIVRSTGAAAAREEHLIGLARTLCDQIIEESRKPKLVRALPVDNLVPGSEVYFKFNPTLRLVWQFRDPDFLKLGDAVDGAPVAEGVYAQYLFAVNDANIFILRYRDPELAARVADRFILELYRPGSRTYRDRGSLKEAEQPNGAWAIACRRGPFAILIPPTKADAEIKQTMRYFFANIEDPDI